MSTGRADPAPVLEIRAGGLADPQVLGLLHEHLATFAQCTPAGSGHALDLTGLRRADISFWTVWDGPTLAGFGALRHLSASHGEIKSMRTARSHLRRGVASRLLEHLIREANARGYSRLSLETGAMDYCGPARRLYASFGFVRCPPFGDYGPDPNSVFMTRRVGGDADGAERPGQ